MNWWDQSVNIAERYSAFREEVRMSHADDDLEFLTRKREAQRRRAFRCRERKRKR